jgi:hypothetical protein
MLELIPTNETVVKWSNTAGRLRVACKSCLQRNKPSGINDATHFDVFHPLSAAEHKT